MIFIVPSMCDLRAIRSIPQLKNFASYCDSLCAGYFMMLNSSFDGFKTGIVKLAQSASF